MGGMGGISVFQFKVWYGLTTLLFPLFFRILQRYRVFGWAFGVSDFILSFPLAQYLDPN